MLYDHSGPYGIAAREFVILLAKTLTTSCKKLEKLMSQCLLMVPITLLGLLDIKGCEKFLVCGLETLRTH